MEKGRFFFGTLIFAIINAMMRKAFTGLPANCTLIPVFAVGQLECYRLAVFANPYQEVLLLRKNQRRGDSPSTC